MPAASPTPPPSWSIRATWAIKALVGSADYFDRGLSGQVNGTLARRSPGSTLKPFIYALGFDQGVLHPADRAARRADLLRALHAGEFRRPVPGPDHRHRCAEPQPQHSRGVGRLAAAAPDLYQFLQSAGVGPWPARSITVWRWCWAAARSACRRWRGLYAMLANRRRAEAAAPRRRDAAQRRHAPAQRRSQLHGDGHAAPACAPR